MVMFAALFITFLTVQSVADEIDENKLADAIFLSEGGYKAQYLYGIRSVHYKDEAEARHICLNTIRNQRKRHAKHNCGVEYLVCLRNRYAPLQAKNDPKGLNSNWLKNVRYFLAKGRK